MMLILLMSMFVMALAMDEYNDSRRIAEDLKIESCVELETEDYEWDDEEAEYLTPTLSKREVERSCLLMAIRCQQSVPCVSDKQRLGLVRRYAPRKAFVGYNYART